MRNLVEMFFNINPSFKIQMLQKDLSRYIGVSNVGFEDYN